MKSFYDFYNKIILEASIHPVILKDSESIIKKAIHDFFLIENKHPIEDMSFEDFVISSKNNKNELKDVNVRLSLRLFDSDDDLDLKNDSFPNFENPTKPSDYYYFDVDEEEETNYEKALKIAKQAPDQLKQHYFKKLEKFEPSDHTIKFYIAFHPKATYEKVADTLTREIISEIQKRINEL